MVGAALVGEDVVWLAGSGGLEGFLEGGFVVADGSAEGVAALHGGVKRGAGGRDGVLFGEGAGAWCEWRRLRREERRRVSSPWREAEKRRKRDSATTRPRTASPTNSSCSLSAVGLGSESGSVS